MRRPSGLHVVIVAAITGSLAVLGCNAVLGVGDFRPGVCDEGATRCAGNTPEACAAGQWKSEGPCDSATCHDGECVGECRTGATRCADDTPQVCADAAWVGETPCDTGHHCQTGACVVDCTSGDVRCLGNAPQACIDGQWQGDMPCSHSTCVLAACQGVCELAEARCVGNTPESCDPATGQWKSQPECSDGRVCLDGSCPAPGCPEACGPGGDESCCLSPVVPGGTYYRSNLEEQPATVSELRLDRFEVTVGRFRLFVAAVVAGYRPAQGAGKHAHVDGGAGLNDGEGTEPGWDAGWNGELASSKAAWDQRLLMSGSQVSPTWTPDAGANERRPINGISWYEAYAFCIWDDGFLPSEAEWNYAAVGGAEQRLYPWARGALDPALAVYTVSGAPADPADVGSLSPAGDGKWGQADLAGNVWEWTADGFVNPYPLPCSDCTVFTDSGGRAIRGGGSRDTVLAPSEGREAADPDTRANIGVRCARSP